MNYEILSSRWLCSQCSSPLRLFFVPNSSEEETQEEEFVCNQVLCEQGHPLPLDLEEEVLQQADQEFYDAFERGEKVSEVWKAPSPEDVDQPFERTI